MKLFAMRRRKMAVNGCVNRWTMKQMEQARKIVELPRRRYSAKDIAAMEMRVRDAEIKVAGANKTQDSWRMRQAGARLRRFRSLLANRKKPVDRTPILLEVEVLRIGAVAIVSMPGEPFAEIGVAVKEASPFAFTMFCGYSDGIGGGYMPTSREYDQGGYEVDRTPYERDANTKLIAEAIALFEQVK